MQNDVKGPASAAARIGHALKDAREKRSFTIDQVQKQTRIHATVLEALEGGRCDDMLTPTYVRSFLKKYAEYLGLDSRSILSEYSRERPAAHEQHAAIKSPVNPARQAGSASPLPVLRYAAVSAAVILVIAAAWIGISKALTVFGKARGHSGNKPKAAVIRPSAASAAKKAVSKAASPKERTAKPAVSPTVNTAIPKGTPIRLVLKVRAQTMVKLRVDGNLLFERVLPSGTEESFTANDRINIYVARAEAIELFLNGRSLGSPGRGVMKNIEVTRSGLKIK